MENVLLLTSILIMLELFEATMQRASTLYGVMEKLYEWYSFWEAGCSLVSPIMDTKIT